LYFVNFVQFIGFGLLPIAYYIIFANLLRSFFNEIKWVDQNASGSIGAQWFSVLILGVIIFPLIIKKKIEELKVAGILLFTGVILFIILMFILRLLDSDQLSTIPASYDVFYEFNFDKAFLSSLSTAFVAYGFQSAFFPIYNSLEKKSYYHGMKFTFLGIGFCFVIYMCIMFVSLYSFGIDIDGDVLKNVEDVSAWESYILRVIFLLVMTTHTPFIFFIGKESLIALVALLYVRGRKEEEDLNNSHYVFEAADDEGSDDIGTDNEDEEDEIHKKNVISKVNANQSQPLILNSVATNKLNMSQSHKLISCSVDYNFSMALPFYNKVGKVLTITGALAKSNKDINAAHDILPDWIYYSVTLSLYAAVVTAGCLIQDVEIIIKFIGSLANATLNFTFPGLFYFIIMRKYNQDKAWWKLALSLSLAIYGTVMGVALTGINVWTTISPVKTD
jgi:amino acid permease